MISVVDARLSRIASTVLPTVTPHHREFSPSLVSTADGLDLQQRIPGEGAGSPWSSGLQIRQVVGSSPTRPTAEQQRYRLY
jgi:hypothetical protein